MNGTMTVKWRCACGGRGCGCCEGTVALTPQPTANRPGLSALSYRIGTHGSILQTMKARLSSEVLDAKGGAKGKPKIEPKRPLAGLRTRDGSDPAIALLDAWATVADVLTFYQERIANEGYLRTATEMRSMFELSRLVGYQPRPGVASSVYLAYTIDANTPQEIVVPQGARAQTVPGQDELPQSFETSQDLKARAGWNRLGLRKSEPQQWNDIQRHGVLYLAGTQTRLKPGDPLLLDAGGPVDPGNVAEPPTPYRVLSVDADPRVDRTAVRIELWNSAAAKKAVGEKLLAIIRDAPKGKFADKVQQALTHLHGIAADDVTIARARNELRGLVRQQQEGSESQPEGPLKPWLARVAAALDEMPAATAAPAEGLPAASALEERIGRLIAPPSKPRANALQLPRSLSSSFEPIGDAGLKMLVAIAPALKPTLAPALAGYEGASPQQSIRVWALRLHAGLFGRAFQRRTKIEFGRKPDQEGVSRGVATISKTVDDGEWPIITSVKKDRISAREVPDTVYLDAAHDGIAPGSWVFIDASAVDRGEVVDENVKHAPMVLPVQTLLVSQVKVVFPKVSRADYGSSGDTTALELNEPWIRFTVKSDDEFRTLGASQAVVDRDFQTIRRTAVYAKSEALALAERPIEEPLCTGSSGGGGARLAGTPRAQAPSGPIELDGLYAGIESGRFVIVSGERADIDATRGVFASEPVMITSVVHDVRAAGTKPGPRTRVVEAMRAEAVDQGDGKEPESLPGLAGDKTHTFIWIDKPLAYCYRRDSVAILGNVVRATHGESTPPHGETLGNGDGAKPLQRFELKQPPLTHLPAPTAAGAESTLRVYVNDVRWHEAAGFVGQDATDHIYLVQTDDRGKTSVQFGNGREGARLPTGFGNVKAVYRNGIGRPGNAGPGQIQQLATRSLGVKDVTNPLRASGGADRESREQVRRNAPLGVKALDRLVSTPDYADFSRTFAGIGKADAQEISDGRRSLVHVTVAGIDDIPIDADSDLLINLRRALRVLGDPFQPLAVEPRELRLLIVSARLRIDPDYLWEPVVTNVRSALLIAFGFEQRELAQGVASSEVLSVIQSVRGVVYVDLDAFGAIDTVVVDHGIRRPRTPAEIADVVAQVVKNGVAPAVQVWRAQRDGSTVLPAQLAVLSSDVDETLVLNQIA